MRLEITRHPIYDKATYRRIQAFVWIFNAYDLLETGIIPDNSPFSVDQDEGTFLSIRQYKDFLAKQKMFTSLYPDLMTHSIIHQLNWEVQRAARLQEEVQQIRMLTSFLNQLWIKGADYFHQPLWRYEKGEKHYEDWQMEEKLA